jgi:hypothetical protein
MTSVPATFSVPKTVHAARILPFPGEVISLETRLAQAARRQDVLDWYEFSYPEYEVLSRCRIGKLHLIAENYQTVRGLEAKCLLRHHTDRSGRRRGWRLTRAGETMLKACQMELGETSGNPKPDSGNKLLRWPSMSFIPGNYAS